LPRITFTTGGIMCLLFIIFVYMSIFLTARKRLNPRNRPGVAALKDDSQTKLKIRFIRELKLAKSCFLVVCTFGFCFLPSMILASSLFSYVERVHFLVSGPGLISHPDWIAASIRWYFFGPNQC
jgi:Na+/melibiose symporter-like transporter